MRLDVVFTIRNNSNIYKYLRENSYWYKYLNRNPYSIKDLEQEMKTKYKLTTQDKVESLANRLDMISKVIEVLK